MTQPKILLLENVATQAAGVRERLSQSGFQVAVSRYEADGLKRLVEWGPDLILVSTAHPAGNFVDYCRRVRALAPAVRIIVTSSLNRDRLFQEHADLQSIVDGVLLRPYSPEEVAAVLASTTVAPPAAVAAPEIDSGDAELRTEFQRQFDAKFLEVEELKRHLDVATRRAASAPGLEWLQSENEHLRQGVEEERKKAALALATEQLKRSEIEIKLDNLLRMKEDFEFRTQNEIDERTGDVESARAEARALRERADKGAVDLAALRVELERALVEKEQIEERLHTLETAGPGAAAQQMPPADDAPRIAALEAELSSQRALVAEGQVVVADISAKAAVLEASLECQQVGWEEREHLLVQVQQLRDQSAEAQAGLVAAGERQAALEKELAEAQAARARDSGALADLQHRFAAAELAASAAQAALAVAGERRTTLDKELTKVQAALAVAGERRTTLQQELTRAQAGLVAAGGRQAALEKELAEAQAARARDSGALADLQNRIAAAESSAATAQAALAVAGERRTTLEQELTQAQAALVVAGERRTTLETELAEAQAARVRETEALAELRERFAAAESAAARARAALTAASERRAALEKEVSDALEARVSDARLAQEQRDEVIALTQELIERAAGAERSVEQAQSARASLEERLVASEAARISVAAEAEALVEQRDSEIAELRARAEELNREIESLRAFKAAAGSDQAVERAERSVPELAEARIRARELTIECERLTATLAERERLFAEQVGTWRGKAEAADREVRQLLSQGAERARTEEERRRSIIEQQQRAGSDLAERELQIEALREKLAAAAESRRRDVLELETRLAARAALEAAQSPVQAELQRIQELLEEVISRAKTEAVDYARRDAELSARLQGALDERRLLQERFDRAGAEAVERERRSSSLLQSAIDHGPAPTAERANLPAIVPPETVPVSGTGPARRRVLFGGLAVVVLGVLLAVFGLRRTIAPPVRERQPTAPRSQHGVLQSAAMTPREVWDRWTRSDVSGGVLVQATLRSEQELRAEVEADRPRTMSDQDAAAELARRLNAFRFTTTYYVTVYLKNLAPGYPAYLDDLAGRFRLRDSSGKEVPAFLPPGHEKDRRIFSFGTGAAGNLVYEATVSLGFDRAGLAPAADYLQLVVSDVGAASRRVLTWELE